MISVAHQIDGRVLKFDNTQWFLVLDNWLLGDLAPLQSGDTVLIFGEFLNDNGWSIHFEPTYFSLKGVDSVLYPYANELGALNNPQMFWSYGWAWLTDVNGYEYRNPWLYFMEVEDASAEAYFNGQKKYFEMRWDAVL